MSSVDAIANIRKRTIAAASPDTDHVIRRINQSLIPSLQSPVLPLRAKQSL
jgi:hypothetical protein